MSEEEKETKEVNEPDPADTTTSISDDSSTMGDIKINLSVVGNIVRLATLEVEGVVSVGNSFVGGLKDMFASSSDHGVNVTENEVGHYVIEVKVQMRFGEELAKVAMEVQQNVSAQVKRMTMNEVAHVDVLIDGIRAEGEEESKSSSEWQDSIGS